MRYLNLSRGTDFIFEPQVNCEIIRFPSGFETTIRARHCTCPVTICARIEDSSDIFLIGQAVDSLRRGGCPSISLFLPFVPNARQDRVMTHGDAFGLKVFADYLNSLRLDRVTVFDPHSGMVEALINNCVAIPQWLFARPLIIKGLGPKTVCAPDLGAIKKTEELVKRVEELYPSGSHTPKMVFCNKKRDPKTGAILDIEIYGNVSGEKVYIVDDIGDGLGTFVPLGKKLRELGAIEVNLVISHGIFSKGLSPIVEAGIDKTYTTNSLVQKDFSQYKEIAPRVTDLGSLILNSGFYQGYLK